MTTPTLTVAQAEARVLEAAREMYAAKTAFTARAAGMAVYGEFGGDWFTTARLTLQAASNGLITEVVNLGLADEAEAAEIAQMEAEARGEGGAA